MKFVQVIELFEDSSAANHAYRTGTAGSRGLGAAQNSGWLHLTASTTFVLFLPNVKSHQFVKDACLAIPFQVHVAQHDPGDYGFWPRPAELLTNSRHARTQVSSPSYMLKSGQHHSHFRRL